MRFRAVASTAALLAMGACGDAPTEPAALLVAEHARVALDVPVPLPSLHGADVMGPAEFDGVLHDLGVWLDAAEARLAAGGDSDPAGLRRLHRDVAEGRALLDEAFRLESAGDRAAAVAALVGAEASLLRTTTAAVAEERIAAAAAAAAACDAQAVDGSARGPAVDIERGRRLLAHAREALAEGDPERALQRGHYAAAMLAGACPQPRAEGDSR